MQIIGVIGVTAWTARGRMLLAIEGWALRTLIHRPLITPVGRGIIDVPVPEASVVLSVNPDGSYDALNGSEGNRFRFIVTCCDAPFSDFTGQDVPENQQKDVPAMLDETPVARPGRVIAHAVLHIG
ncbi:hypothetical protein [Komagataeibacter sp. FNDCF1]|uniref:hypothetical protein n=1 Tax=Komagataeibacter sp. FNDCF1 TaxID=2878681 RepID=UPI001E58FA60|nr:hypothetical protein [Komagataeibacter sp. FNDCF1]MCE2564156.1 hypothetical protein [Komagataeibacter sp. FNDCF1]